uniref:Chromosome transmission fidelity protein 8 n=1 Tax=Peronospora matthiolae TaxID=2874970 RepID=A0AAV1UTZ5_9STRA
MGGTEAGGAVMLVPVRVDQAANEWCLLEFQGDLIRCGDDALDLRDVDIGTLRFGPRGALTLRIGTHVVTGRVQTLPKPLAILRKDAMEDVVDGATDGRDDAAGGRIQYEVVGIARTRVVFASRPKPVLA